MVSMKEWETIQLYHACKLVAGYAFKSKDFGDYPDKVIKITHIVPPTVDMKNLTGVDLSQYERKKLIKYIAKQGDYVLAMTGATIGKMGRIEESEAYVNQRVLLFKNNPNVDKDYLFYVLQQNKFQQYILNHIDSESAQPNISAATVGKYEFLLPSLKIQNKIGKFLRLIDDKINVNNRINDNLEQQAQSLYYSWFVDFEPFDGVMPSSWYMGTLFDLALDIICGKTPSTKRPEYYGSEIPFITIPDMHRQVYAVTTERSLSTSGAASQSGKMLPQNSICVSCIGSTGLVCLVSTPSQTNQQINSIVPAAGVSPYYIYLLAKTLSNTIQNIGSGGSTICNLNKSQFSSIEVLIPSETSMREFDKIVRPLFAEIHLNQCENLQLAELRDTLLPRLLSGEIDVSSIKI